VRARACGSWPAALERGENEEGLALLEQAMAHASYASSASNVRFNLALAMGRLGRDREALQEFLRLQEETGKVELHVARTLERLGRDPEAETYYRQALASERRADERDRADMEAQPGRALKNVQGNPDSPREP
jgi:tetratricopeptide (TPR) repeat protein